ncbi:FAD binding domain-containing protein [Pholiota molesta]|nr:FAD binding domain-containing protein [Pholiota molesta]
MLPTTHSNVDVLIIGAGPSGLMAGLILTTMNLKVKIIDRRMPNETSGQADGIQPRMLEIWESLGIGKSLREKSEHVYRMVTYVPNERKDGIKHKSQGLNIPVPSARYQYEVLARIDIIESILGAQLLKNGVSPDYPVVPSSMAISKSPDEEYPIQVNVSWLDEDILKRNKLSQESRSDPALIEGIIKRKDTISTKFVIGCDGGKSWTRKQLHIAMEGEQTDLKWGVIDFTPLTNFPTPRAKNIIQSPLAGALGYLPRPNGTARVYVMLGEGKQADDQNVDAMDTISKVLRRGFEPYKMEIQDPTWCSIFQVSQRVAERFSGHGRVFIAGDACHTHSPKAGQGANASMSDTFNLAWKIGYVANGWAKQNILDTYETERKPFSEELIKLDQQIFKLFSGQTVAPQEYMDLWHRQIMFASGIGLRYSSSLINTSGQSLAGKLFIGERLPSMKITRSDDWRPLNLQDIAPFDGKFRLFVLPGDISTRSGIETLHNFGTEFISVLKNVPSLNKLIEVYVLIDNKPSLAIEALELPLAIIHGRYERLFFTQGEDGKSLYGELALKPSAILNRPDNHVAALSSLDKKGVRDIESYFMEILPEFTNSLSA